MSDKNDEDFDTKIRELLEKISRSGWFTGEDVTKDQSEPDYLKITREISNG